MPPRWRAPTPCRPITEPRCGRAHHRVPRRGRQRRAGGCARTDRQHRRRRSDGADRQDRTDRTDREHRAAAADAQHRVFRPERPLRVRTPQIYHPGSGWPSWTAASRPGTGTGCGACISGPGRLPHGRDVRMIRELDLETAPPAADVPRSRARPGPIPRLGARRAARRERGRGRSGRARADRAAALDRDHRHDRDRARRARAATGGRARGP